MTIYSHSRLSTFEQCPRKFKFKYLDKLKPDMEQTIEGFLGNKVHETLEWIYLESLKQNPPELDKVIEYYSQNWKNSFTPQIKIIKTEFTEQDYFEKGLKFLIDYFIKHSPFKDNTIEIEKRIIFNLDEEHKLQGYIDRLVHHKDTNIFEIHDYKTSSFLKSQEELDNDRQLALYSIGIKEMFENVQDVHLIWHFLAFNKKIISKRTNEQLENLKQEVLDLIKKIESTKEFPPQPTKLCRWCEFRSHCDLFNRHQKNNESPHSKGSGL